nr:hypothetical protein [bacterium]
LAWRKTAAAGRFFAGAALGGATAVAAAAVAWGGIGCWKRWVEAAAAMPPDIIPPRLGNYAPGWYFSRWAGTDLSIPLALGLFGVAAAAVAAGARRRMRSPEIFSSSWQAAIALGALVFILSSRLVWIHYYLLAVPAALILTSPPAKGWQIFLGAAGFALIALDPMLAVVPPPGIPAETLAVGTGAVLLLIGLIGKIVGKRPTPEARPG